MLSQISDFSYDLKIWEVEDEYPSRLVFDITGLERPEYRPDFDLRPATR